MDQPTDKKADDKFPLRENCDPNDPEEMFWWMFASLPGMNNAFFLMPIIYYRLVSKRLSDLGAMVKCPECGHRPEPKLKLQLPPSGDPQWATGQGKWVPIDTPDVEVPLVRRAVDALSPADRAAFYKELARRADFDPEEP